ncbi:MAG: LysM peptidoglycan-binding domain-containing protein, partial [Chlamydiia bacterium]|nr:LysM peptidoglycan-binding domain-containing protein [Chlamydiia bacterium]
MRSWAYLSSISICAAALLSSCSGCYEPRNYYAEEAFLRQRYERERVGASQVVDEVVREDLVVDLESDMRPEWQRKGYETVDEWQARLEALLYLHRDQILALRETVDDLEGREKDLIDKIQRYRKSNDQLRNQVEEAQAPERRSQKKQSGSTYHASIPDLPFNVHLIRKGDTLYSIAMHYYKDGSRVHDIMHWNQGWLRYAERILA